jgi:hypothetical protein
MPSSPADLNVEKLPPDSVLAMLPVQLEARWQNGRLRVRIWPDIIHQAPHDEQHSESEIAGARAYWEAVAQAAGDPDALRAAFAGLAAAFGPTRAAYLATSTSADTVDSLVPRAEDDPFVPSTRALPDRFVLQGWRQGKVMLEVVGKDVPATLITGFDTTPLALASVSNEPGKPISLPKSMAWMTDFQEALSVGLAFDVLTSADLVYLDTLLVYGVRQSDSGKDTLTSLLQAHRFARGSALVPIGTPTNHFEGEPSGLPDAATREQQIYEAELGPRKFTEPPTPDGLRLARALGLDPSAMERVVGYESCADEAARAALAASWSVTMGGLLDDLVGAAPSRVESVRSFALAHLRADGPLPCFRVGRQPYGVLPAVSLDHWVADPDEALDPYIPSLLMGARNYFRAKRPTETYGGTLSEALRLLPRPVSLGVETVSVVAGLAASANHFRTLASTISTYTFQTVPETWLTSSLTSAREGEVQALALDATWDLAGACARWGSAQPASIVAEEQPGSMIGRMVRQAVLIEWARLSEEVIRSASTREADGLAKNEAGRGPGIWLEALQQAMTGSTGPLSQGTAKIVKDRIRSLDQPDLGAPGATRLAEVRGALAWLGTLPNEMVHASFVGLLELFSHRTDAWFTAAADRRLASVRASAPDGVVVGAWGLLTEVAMGQGAFADHRWAPSADHAATAGILAARGSGLDVDLPARRARVAAQLLDGVAQGMSAAALLGARAERLLLGAETVRNAIVGRFPLAPAGGRIDGLALATAGPAAVADLGAVAQAAAVAVRDEADALADVLLAQSVHELARGEASAAWQPLEQLAEGSATPDAPSVLTPPTPGTTVALRVAAVLPPTPASTWSAGPRAQASPAAEAWAASVLGEPDRWDLVVEVSGRSDALSLAKLECSALDLVYAEPAELLERVHEVFGTPDVTLPEEGAWLELTGLASAARAALTRARSLRPEHLDLPWVEYDRAEPEDATTRADAAVDGLTTLRDRLESGQASALEAAGWGLVVPGVSFTSALPEEVRLALLASADARLAAAEGTADERLTAVFGAVLPAAGSFEVPAGAADTLENESPQLDGYQTLDGIAWLEGAGRVRPQTAQLAEALARSEARHGHLTLPRLVQVPFAKADPWIATSFLRSDGARPVGRVSVWAHAPQPLAAGEMVQGLLFDAWTERIPLPVHTSALALHTNAPNSRPPQLVLLVAPPVRGAKWTSLAIAGAVRGALELARMRVEPPQSWESGGGEPTLVLGATPASGALAFSFSAELP